MNAPLPKSDLAATSATLHLFALFHLNLAFSSIEEEQRDDVIARCYWPLLRLAETHGPIGIEATGFTLEEIARRDPDWIGRARALIGCGKIELIGSGYAQTIGPLLPWRVTEANLAIGQEIYEHLFGIRPQLALVNEQAYSAGLVELYRDAGYRAILADWDNAAAHHPEWPVETRYRPQTALGADGGHIGLLWTNTVAFQKLQRLAHGDIGLDEYAVYVRSHRNGRARTFCLYASDAEVFDFRPGRYRTEEQLGGTSEWTRIAQALEVAATEPGCRLIAPSEALGFSDHSARPLSLESAACPVPVKKQRKYNLSRWAVTGRDDIAINAACERIYRGLVERNAGADNWKELCYLWASDFRTHITDRRWAAYVAQLKAAEEKWTRPHAQVQGASAGAEARQGRHIELKTRMLSARLDQRRGLAIESLKFAGHAKAAIGGLPHGHFDDIALQADWYTGDCVFEAPGEPKITDLEWCDACQWQDAGGDIWLRAHVETPKGPIEKTLRFSATMPQVDFDIVFHWEDWGRGSLRLGHVTLLPEAFDWERLKLATHNGGRTVERFALAGQNVEHGAPVSFLVSASHGIGMTEGWAELGDGRTNIRVSVDRAVAPMLGLLTHRRIGGSLFCQLMLSAMELDETRKPFVYQQSPRRFRFSIAAA